MTLNSRPSRLPIVSLDNAKTARSIFRKLSHTRIAHQELRRKLFQHVAQSARLQHLILKVLMHVEVQREVLLEAAKSPTLKRKLLKMAGENPLTKARKG
jgi:hypothetical protein